MNKGEHEYRDVSPSIKDIIWEIFSHYKFILLVTVIVTLLVSGIKYLDYKNQVKQVQNSVPVTLEEIKNGLTDIEIADVELVHSWENQLGTLQEYKDHSLLYEIDPNTVDVVSIQWNVKLTDKDGLDIDEQAMRISSIIDSYCIYVQNGGLVANIRNDLSKDIDSKYLQELISVERTSTSFLINIMIPESLLEENLSEKVQTYLKVYESEVSEKLYAQEILLMNCLNQVIVDTNLSSKIVAMENQINNLNSQIVRTIATFTPKQLMVYNGEVVEGDIQNVTFDTKYVILGVLLGFVGSCGSLLLVYLLSDSVKNAEGITGAFSWNSISSVYVDSTGGFYAKIRKRLQYNSLGSLEEQMEQVALKISYICEYKEINQIVLTSSMKKLANNDKVIKLLKTYLEQNDIIVIESVSCLDDISNWGPIISVGNVILLEEIMKSNYKDLEKIKNDFELQNINILGVITIHNI